MINPGERRSAPDRYRPGGRGGGRFLRACSCGGSFLRGLGGRARQTFPQRTGSSIVLGVSFFFGIALVLARSTDVARGGGHAHKIRPDPGHKTGTPSHNYVLSLKNSQNKT